MCVFAIEDVVFGNLKHIFGFNKCVQDYRLSGVLYSLSFSNFAQKFCLYEEIIQELKHHFDTIRGISCVN